MMNLDKKYFDQILSGKKIYETRVFDEKRKKLKLLEKIEFVNRDDGKSFKAMIVELSWFPDFRAAIVEVGVKKVLPDARSLDEGVKTYHSFPGYKENSKKFGVLRFKICLIE